MGNTWKIHGEQRNTMGKTWSAEELWGEGPGLAMSAVVITNADRGMSGGVRMSQAFL